MSSFRQLMMRNKGGNIPIRYTVVDYIESTGTQYINTSVKTSGTLSFEIDYQNTDSGTSDRKYIGFGVDGLGQGSFGLVVESYGTLQMHKGSSPYRISLGANNTLRHKAIYGVPAYFDGTYLGNALGSSFGYSKDIYVFAGNKLMYNGTSEVASDFSKMKLYSLKMSDNGELLRDFVPVYDNTTQKYGLYDLVSQTFFGNLGSGDFSGGNIVVLYAPKLDGTEVITTMQGKSTPIIKDHTLTGDNGSQQCGCGYLSEGWDNTGLWQLTFKGRINEGANLFLVCNSTQRDYNLIALGHYNIYKFNGSSSTSATYQPSIQSATMQDIIITKIDSTTVKIQVGSGSATTISGFTPLSQTNKCYIGVDSWGNSSTSFGVISDIKVIEI